MDQRRSEPHALPHPSRVAAQGAVLRPLEADQFDGSVDRWRQRRDAVQRRVELDEGAAGHELIHALVLRHQPHASENGRIASDGLAQHGHRTARGVGEAGDHAQQGGLSGTVGAQQSRHARPKLDRHVVDGDDVAEPARHALDDDRRAAARGAAVRRVRHSEIPR